MTRVAAEKNYTSVQSPPPPDPAHVANMLPIKRTFGQGYCYISSLVFTTYFFWLPHGDNFHVVLLELLSHSTSW